MSKNRTPEAAILTVGLLAASCSASTETAAPPTASSVAPSTEASKISPTPSQMTAAKVAGRVCEGFFAQSNPDGTIWLVGRPAVTPVNFPEYVDANPTGVEITAYSPEPTGSVQWYSLDGQLLNNSDVNCHDATLQARKVTRPEGVTYQASTNPGGDVTQPWDSRALNPEGLGGVFLDYGSLTTHAVAGVMQEAGRRK